MYFFKPSVYEGKGSFSFCSHVMHGFFFFRFTTFTTLLFTMTMTIVIILIIVFPNFTCVTAS